MSKIPFAADLSLKPELTAFFDEPTNTAARAQHSLQERNHRRRIRSIREARNKTLAMPRLIFPSLQVNMRAGRLPPPDESGKRFLKVAKRTLIFAAENSSLLSAYDKLR